MWQRPLRRHGALFLAVAVLLALLLAACGGGAATATPARTPPRPSPTAAATPVPSPTATATPAPQPKRGGTLKTRMFRDPRTFDAHGAVDGGAWFVYGTVFDTLIELEPPANKIVPNLADSWAVTEGGTVYTFRLARGIAWHDGTPFTSKDVAYTFGRIIFGTPADIQGGASHMKAFFAAVDKVEAPDDFTIRMTLKRPSASLLATLTYNQLTINPSHVPAEKLKNEPVGTGAFKFAGFKATESTKVERNPAYRKPGLPYLDGAEQFIIPSAANHLAAFRTGKFDLWDPISGGELGPAANRDQIKSSLPDLLIQALPITGAELLLLNKSFPPFQDDRVRRAIQVGFDRGRYVDAALQGAGQGFAAAMPPPEFGGIWGIPLSQQQKWPGVRNGAKERQDDVAEAKRLLAAAGITDASKLKVVLRILTMPGWHDVRGPVIVEALKDINIDAEIQPIDSPTYQTKVLSQGSEYRLAFGSGAASIDDPAQMIGVFDASKGGRNGTGFAFPEVDQLLEQQDGELDGAKRLQLVYQLQQIIYDRAATIRLGSSQGYGAWRGYVKDYAPVAVTNRFAYKFEKVWFDRQT